MPPEPPCKVDPVRCMSACRSECPLRKRRASLIHFAPPEAALPADAALLKRAAELFAKARKPILAVGLGAVQAKLQSEIQALAEET